MAQSCWGIKQLSLAEKLQESKSKFYAEGLINTGKNIGSVRDFFVDVVSRDYHLFSVLKQKFGTLKLGK